MSLSHEKKIKKQVIVKTLFYCQKGRLIEYVFDIGQFFVKSLKRITHFEFKQKN